MTSMHHPFQMQDRCADSTDLRRDRRHFTGRRVGTQAESLRRFSRFMQGSLQRASEMFNFLKVQ
jgi:hypothetical protein